MFSNKKKGFSSVVATSLLLVVVVVSVLGYSGWFANYASEIMTTTEITSNSALDNTLKIERLVGSNLFVINNIIDNLSINSITVDGNICNLSNVDNLSLGVNTIVLVGCLDNLSTDRPEILLTTNKRIVEKYVFIDGGVSGSSSSPSYLDCTLNGTIVSHSNSYGFFSDSLIAFGLSCNDYKLVRTCTDGTLSGSDTFNLSTCAVVGQDTDPDVFSFTNQSGVEFSTLITSNVVVPTGYDGSLSVGITGDGNPQLSVNSEAWTSSSSMNLTDNLTIRLTSSANALSQNNVTLTFGYSIGWSVTTRDYNDCSILDGLQLNHSQGAIFYNSSIGSVCNGITRTCTDGVLSGSSSFNLSSCTVMSSSLSCITDSDSDGQISSSCANYPMTNTTNEGDLDINDNDATVEVDSDCIFLGNKSDCEDNLVVNGCGTGTVLDTGTNLCWQRDLSTAGSKTWVNAKSYCDSLSLGGHTDWSLPNRQEYFTIADLARENPAIIGGNNNKFTNVLNDWYWAITTYGVTTSYAWGFGFAAGGDGTDDKINSHYVVCVRH